VLHVYQYAIFITINNSYHYVKELIKQIIDLRERERKGEMWISNSVQWVSGITLMRYAQRQNMWITNNLKVYGSKNMKQQFEDTKAVIRICISKKNRQHNGKEKGRKDKQRSTKHTHKNKYRVTRRSSS
jgi:hypothetical protein